jgi:hypothetical protein
MHYTIKLLGDKDISRYISHCLFYCYYDSCYEWKPEYHWGCCIVEIFVAFLVPKVFNIYCIAIVKFFVASSSPSFFTIARQVLLVLSFLLKFMVLNALLKILLQVLLIETSCVHHNDHCSGYQPTCELFYLTSFSSFCFKFFIKV